MFEVIIFDEFGGVQNDIQENSWSTAKRLARDGARYHQGRAVVSEDHITALEYKYEDGQIYGYDDEGNRVYNV